MVSETLSTPLTALAEQNGEALPERVIKARGRFVPIDFAEVYRYRELLGFLIWRDILVRYKQTLIGVAWAVVQPVLTMIIFLLLFGKLAKLPSQGEPYPVMIFAALLPWEFFANALTQGSNSVVAASGMISKVYFPRLIIPASATASGVVDFFVALVILAGLMWWYEVGFRIHMLLFPVFMLVAFLTAFGASLWLSALNVRYRDIRHVVPFIIRIGMYASPVGYVSSVVPSKWRFLYSLNPMVGVIDGFRWAIFGPHCKPYWPGFFTSFGIVVIMVISGAYYFRSVEKTFADVI